MSTREHQAQQRQQAKARYAPWCQAAIFGARAPAPKSPTTTPPGQIDRKRAAAGDFDS